VGLAGGQACAQRQQRLRPLQRLALRLLVDAQHDGIHGRREVKAYHTVDPCFGVGIGRELEGLRATTVHRLWRAHALQPHRTQP
jgi:hypothetical protein